MNEELNIWDVKEDELVSKTSSKFGLNSDCRVTKIELSNKDKDGNERDLYALNYVVRIGDKDNFRSLYFNKVLKDTNNNDINPDSEKYPNLFKSIYSQNAGVVKHILKAFGITDAQLATKKMSITGSSDTWVDAFVKGVENMLTLLPANYTSIPVDVFLEYQWNIKEGQNRTFPQLPNNMKGGYWIVPSMKPVGSWTEQISEDGLSYIDGAGNKHIFERDSNFMESNKGTQQSSSNDNSIPNIEAARTDSWD